MKLYFIESFTEQVLLSALERCGDSEEQFRTGALEPGFLGQIPRSIPSPSAIEHVSPLLRASVFLSTK